MLLIVSSVDFLLLQSNNNTHWNLFWKKWSSHIYGRKYSYTGDNWKQNERFSSANMFLSLKMRCLVTVKNCVLYRIVHDKRSFFKTLHLKLSLYHIFTSTHFIIHLHALKQLLTINCVHVDMTNDQLNVFHVEVYSVRWHFGGVWRGRCATMCPRLVSGPLQSTISTVNGPAMFQRLKFGWREIGFLDWIYPDFHRKMPQNH